MKDMAADRIGIDQKDGVATVALKRVPANALNIEFAEEILEVLDHLEGRDDVRAVVLTGTASVFCAGLDLKEAPRYDQTRQNRMLALLNRLFYRLYGLSVPTVAAINGHAIAGGLVLALACDWRVGVADGALFGLTEVSVGVAYPVAAMTIVRSELGCTAARQLVLGGTNRDSTHALSSGMVDELQTAEHVVARSETIARQLSAWPAEGYLRIKRQLRRDALREIANAIAGDEPLHDKWILSGTAQIAEQFLRRTN
jgi:enoyl-CoA hydratase/carnithine racemase